MDHHCTLSPDSREIPLLSVKADLLPAKLTPLELCGAGPWLNNCVGYFNYGHFFRFLLYVSVTVFYAIVVIIARIVNIEFKFVGRVRVCVVSRKPRRPVASAHAMALVGGCGWTQQMVNMESYELVLIVVDLVFLVPIFLSVAILLGFHLYYIATNTTTIEAFQKERVERAVRKQGLKPVRIYFN